MTAEPGRQVPRTGRLLDH